MHLKSESVGEVTIVRVEAARIDASVAIQFKDQMREVADGPQMRTVLDMKQVEFLDSSGLGALVASMKHMGSQRKLELAGLTPTVSKVLTLTCMDKVFKIHPTAADALASGSSAA